MLCKNLKCVMLIVFFVIYIMMFMLGIGYVVYLIMLIIGDVVLKNGICFECLMVVVFVVL